MFWKYFTTRFGQNAPSKIKELRKEFPGYSFLGGMHKDKRGIFVLLDRDNKDYGDKWELPNGDTFWSPTPERLEEIKLNLNKYKSDWQDRIIVKLTCGKELAIFPAAALPAKVMFTRKVIQDANSPFDTNVDYGALAYKLYDRSQKNDSIKLDDPMMLELISLALKYSYTLPEPLWDALGLINFNDIDKIFAAALGMDWEFLQDELKKSNVASQQTTGASAT